MVALDDVKAWLKVTTATTDPQIQGLIDRATAFIERETNWYFGPLRAVTEVLDGTGLGVMFISQPPVDDPVVLVIRNRSSVGADWTVVDAADYEVRDRGLYAAGIWAQGQYNFEVAYNQGFCDVPGDIAQLLLDLVAAKWRGNDENPAMKSERIGDYSYTRADLTQLDSWASVRNNWVRKRI